VRNFATVAATGALAFMVADGIWLGLLMTSFYRDRLAPIARLTDGRLSPNWTAALAVYVLLGLGIALLVVPRATSAATAAAFGALFGLVVYGVYDFTNLSTLSHWPAALAAVDIAWGASAAAICSAAAWSVSR
jgi:uncharacterized membrane protein